MLDTVLAVAVLATVIVLLFSALHPQTHTLVDLLVRPAVVLCEEHDMRQLRDDTHLILDGEVRVYRRERSKRWQAAFVIDGHTIRISTGKRDLG